MSETDPGMQKPDRTSLEYLESALDKAFEVNDMVFGVAAPRPPESFEELVAAVNAVRDGCGMDEEVDEMIALIACSPDPDEITRLLPYDLEDNHIVLILPE